MGRPSGLRIPPVAGLSRLDRLWSTSVRLPADNAERFYPVIICLSLAEADGRHGAAPGPGRAGGGEQFLQEGVALQGRRVLVRAGAHLLPPGGDLSPSGGGQGSAELLHRQG